MKKQTRTRLILVVCLGLSSINRALAQDETDALRFSTIQMQATARAVGIGNALGSIGGEFSTISVNPAGLGIYRSSELVFSPNLLFDNSKATYTGQTATGSGSHFSISNAGIVSTKLLGGGRNKSQWTSVAFGFGLNRTADFTRDYNYHGTNTTSSGSYVFEADANAYGVSSNNVIQSPADLGWQSYLLDTFNGGYLSVVYPRPNSPVSQHMLVRERGGISEMTMGVGGSYQDKLMLGATLGIPILRFLRERTYEEHDLSGNFDNDFDWYTYHEDLRTTGVGVNLKLGFIYKISDGFRIGAAFHTPTFYGMTDYFNSAVTANTENFHGVTTAVALENQYNYNLTTPLRAILSGTGMLGNRGFVTVDYEYVDYKSARFNFDYSSGANDYESYINGQIRNLYQGASNVRAGLELRFDPIMLRGGVGYYGSPYKYNSGYNRMDYSLGLGWRVDRIFLDFAYLHRVYKNDEQPYVLPDTDKQGSLYYGMVVPTATITNYANMLVLTFGVKM